MNYLFVGEKPSETAASKGWEWTDGRLAASTLFDALRAAGIDPDACRFINLYGDDPRNPERPVPSRIEEIRTAMRDGWRVVALGKKVARHLVLAHVELRHPAARGAGRARDAYRTHVAESLAA